MRKYSFPVLLLKGWTVLGFLVLGTSLSFAQSQKNYVWPLDSIRTDLNNDNEPDYIGQEVIVTGIANIGTGLFHEHYLQSFIQNDSSGLSIFKMNIEPPFQFGDSIKAWGTINLYNGLAEVRVDSYQVYQRVGELPEIKPLSLAIKDPVHYLGMLVKGEGTIVSAGSMYNGDYVLIKEDQNEKNMMVYVSNFHKQYSDFNFGVLREGDKVRVTGIVSEYNPDFPEHRTYKLFLRTPDDLEYVGLPLYYKYMLFVLFGIILAVIVLWTLVTRRQVNTKTTEIQASLDEKEVLLKEIHHRVKNSLATVSSLLELQLYNSESEAALKALKDSQSRIKSIALIHDKLYKTDSLSSVEMDKYVQELVEAIHSTFSEYQEAVVLHFQIDNIELSIDQVIPCGLLINELVVNAFKHAFQKNEQGILTVSLKKEAENIVLQVADNGPGLPSDEGFKKEDGLGSLLIRSFADKLNARMEVNDSSEGVTFKFTFPKQ